MNILFVLVGVLIALVLLGWLGLRIKPAPLPAFPQQAGEVETIPLPEDLPAPVERFYLIYLPSHDPESVDRLGQKFTLGAPVRPELYKEAA